MPDQLDRRPHPSALPALGLSEVLRQISDPLLAQLPFGIALLDSELRYRQINAALAALNGLAPEAHLGRTVAEVVPHLAVQVEPILRQVLATGEAVLDVPFNASTKPQPGPPGDWLSSFFPIYGLAGEITGVEVVVADVTRLTRSEALLRQQAALLEHAHVLIRDRDSRIVAWHEGVQRLYGWSPGEALGRISHELFHTHFPTSLEEVQVQLFAEGRWEGKLVHRRRDGSELVVASHQVLFRDSRGEPTHILEVNNDITAFTRAREELREREAQLELALDVAGLGIWQYDPATRLHTLDERARRQLGVTQEVLALADMLPRIHPEDRGQLQAVVERALDPAESDGASVVEFRVLQPDGSYRWLATQSRVSFAGEGASRRPVSVLGTAQDITARKAAEAALRAAHAQAEASARAATEHAARLESLIAHAPVGIALMDRELRYRHINAHLAAVNGFSPEEHLGRTVRELLPTIASQVEQVYQRVMETGEPLPNLEIEGETRAEPGVLRSWRVSHFPVRTAEALLGAGVIVMDVTEQRQAERALREQHQQLAVILENVGESVLAVRPDGSLVALNRVARQLAMLGQETRLDTLDEAVVQSSTVVCDSDGRVLTPEEWPVTRVLRGERLTNAEFRMRVASAPECWLSLSGAPVYDADGQVTLAVITSRDITERKRDEATLQAHTERLSQANAELTRALKLKDEFLAMMSHELRTPLTAVLGISQAMEEGLYGPVSEQQLYALGQVSQSGRHLLGILSDILDLARIGTGGERLARESLDVDALCRMAVQMVHPRAEQKGIRLQRAVDAGVHALCADERRLTQILVNLLDNAVKFTPAGGMVGLEVTASASDERIAFTVWDTGIGIAADDMGRLFQPFTQLDGRLSRSYEGIGLGLALVQRLTELHGGSVHLESTPGLGSRFTVTMPWSLGDNVVPGGPPPPPPSGRWASPPRVLIADDHETTLELYAVQLAQLGCEVVSARDGAEALERIRAHRPDIAVLDIQMPRLDGLGVIRSVRATPELAALPIIAVTALAMPGDRERCLEAGANHYLAKPVSAQSLVAAIAAIVARPDPPTRV